MDEFEAAKRRHHERIQEVSGHRRHHDARVLRPGAGQEAFARVVRRGRIAGWSIWLSGTAITAGAAVAHDAPAVDTAIGVALLAACWAAFAVLVGGEVGDPDRAREPVTGKRTYVKVPWSITTGYDELNSALGNLTTPSVGAQTQEAAVALREDADRLLTVVIDAIEAGGEEFSIVSEAVGLMSDLAASGAALAEREFALSVLGGRRTPELSSAEVVRSAGAVLDETIAEVTAVISLDEPSGLSVGR